MGTCYYGVCHDCQQRIDLDKFYMFPACQNIQDVEELAQSFDRGDCRGSKDVFVLRCLRLFTFMNAHAGHRVEVLSEHQMPDEAYDWATVMEEPHGPDRGRLELDWTDPASPSRVILKTALGEIIIDNRRTDVNCFRFVNGRRVDTLLLNQKPDGES